MKTYIYVLILIPLFTIFAQNAKIHHDLMVKIIPEESRIEVIDEITVDASILKENFSFSLNNNLSPKLLSEELTLEIIRESASINDVGMDRDIENSENRLLINEYSVSGFSTDSNLVFNVMYEGKIESPIEQSMENYQRGFTESPGIISDIGVYLAGSTYWIPTVENEFVVFNLTTELPQVWRTVSQGKRTEDKIENERHIDTWISDTPQEEIFLIAAKFNEYKFAAGSVDAFAFLRTPDESLANKYLETTAQYLDMYRKLIGPFPYTKFALVENFWETGYGMPSFTLLGEKIIRFPFILHSSYPHELLHNWWGNSVYVDFNKGNWCEGLTAYMADHLIKEQREQAVEYRRSTLQKFTDMVNEENDIPLNKFLSRFDGASEAIGYGKALMFFHMLRSKVGDENFIKAFQVFNRENKFKKVSYEEIRNAFENTTGEDLKWFFDQWIERKGAPELTLSKVDVEQSSGQYELSFTINQIQKEDPFILDVSVTVVNENGSESENYTVKDRRTTRSLKLDEKPLKILVDPQFDLLRKLDSREIPPAFTKAYGAKETFIILPDSNETDYELYKKFTNGWIKGKEEEYTVSYYSEIETIPNDKTVWILGEGNEKLSEIEAKLSSHFSSIGLDSIKLSNKTLVTQNNSFFLALANPYNIEEVVIFLSIGNENAVPGLLRKLPHYGKYSYLAFEGDEPTNIEKGQWNVVNSPLNKIVYEAGAHIEPQFEKRSALAELAPAFSSDRMIKHVAYLASSEMRGRGLGTEELDSAADYIANKFEEYGLLPGADDKTYFQLFKEEFNEKGSLNIQNVIGIIPGNNDNLKEAVVISAHYDHLGLGWPDVRSGNEGKIHFGADDNASGIAVLLELAKSMGKSFNPSRTIIFVAFSGEEAGLKGSKYFVNNYKKFQSDKIFANLNFDTVGRLLKNKLMILNGNSSREWKFIFMGTEYTTGIPSELITQKLDASDQVSFIEKGIPAIQFFTGPNEDYHKPGDTIEKIDGEGLIKVATVAKEVIQYLTERKDPLEFTGKTLKERKEKSMAGSSNPGRRVSTGTMPNFSFTGKGVKVSAVADDSPGSVAGLKKGDIIKKVNDEIVASLNDYSNILKRYSPGDKIIMEVDRAGKKLQLELILEER